MSHKLTRSQTSRLPTVFRTTLARLWWVAMLLEIGVLSFGLTLLGKGLKELVGDRVELLFGFATNPALGLLVGVLATALVQSSSAVTSIVVGLVATGMPVTTAIPIVMGANIGTTITNTLLSLGQVGDRERFQRAFAAATVHDFFNVLCVVVFLPLEVATHFLARSSGVLASGVSQMVSQWGLSFEGAVGLKMIVAPLVKATIALTAGVPTPWHGALWLGLGLAIVLAAIAMLAKTLTLAIERFGAGWSDAVGAHPLFSMGAGAGITTIVQSSSTTTSLMVPLAASEAWTLEAIYPFTLGANIGTCVTAFLAATAIVGDASFVALQIAIAHLLHNALGVAVIYGLPWLRMLPLRGARWLARSAENPWAVAGYVLGMFFLLPILAIGASLLT